MLIGSVAKLLSAARERLRHRQHQRVTPGEMIARGHVHDWLSKSRHPRFFQRGFA